jgi:NAD(P)-dependent dehydrogenase (short-subunit alcohol dehydrogenase family)
MDKKVVLITGAGRGLGLAIAKAFISENFEVIATDVHDSIPPEIAQNELFSYLKLDVTSEIDVSQCASFVQEKFGRLDVLISNAGVFDFYPVSEAGADELKRIMNVNFLGLANLTKYFLFLLIQSQGRLIVISSESYKVPAPFQPYAVSKQALESLYNAIRIELALKGIKSILIRPGAIKTKILEDTLQFTKSNRESFFDEEFASFLDAVPRYIGKIVSPEKVAKVVLKAGTLKNPKSIYQINHNPIVRLLAILPNKVQYFLIEKNLITKH